MLAVVAMVMLFAIWRGLENSLQPRRAINAEPARTFYETVPGVPIEGLPAARRQHLLAKLNSTTCTCECGLSLARCRNTDQTCKNSLELALKFVNDSPD